MKTALSSIGLVASLLLAGCSSGEASESVGFSQEKIIGGIALDSAAMDAIGSLVYIYHYSGTDSYSSPFCSGTLVGERAVVSAEHCVQSVSLGQEIGFAIGSNALKPKRVVPIVAWETETSITGGFIGLGSDVSVLHLGEAVKNIEPFVLGDLAAADIGTRFVGAGYGTQDIQGSANTRRAGSMTFDGTGGKFFEHAFGTFEGFLKAIPNIDEIRWQVGDVTTPYGLQQAQTIYDGRVLITDYEGYFGFKPGDAQSCHGDSGGPIFRIANGRKTLYGVTSWGTHRFGSFCDFGSVYATFGSATKTFLASALAWVDPCDDLSNKGFCDGTKATRCSAPKEGVRRKLVTECADLGLACGTGTDGQVICN